MGSLTNFNVKEIKEKYGLTSFVETGTWKGDSVEYAFQVGFSPIVSIELKQEFWEAAVKRFSNRSAVISILLGSSQGRLCDAIAGLTGATLWWLDAHLQDFYGLSPTLVNRFPLEDELRLISEKRDVSRDVFLIDDLRIYETGPFTKGNAPIHHCVQGGIGFIDNVLGSTHTIEKSYVDEGYIVCKPKVLP